MSFGMFVQFINFIFILLHSTCAQEEKKVKTMTSLKHLSMHYVFNFVKQTLGHVLNCCVKGIFQTF